MNQLEFRRNELQMDYFSESYQRFEADFYRYSALNTPLTFLTDDIMRSMAKSQQPYFKLNKENAKDNRDHYFLFSIEPIENNKLIKKFTYLKTVYSIKSKPPVKRVACTPPVRRFPPAASKDAH